MKNEREQKNDLLIQNTKPWTTRSFAFFPHSQQTNHHPEKCWNGPNATKRPKQFKQDHPAGNRNDGQENGSLTHPGPLSILTNHLN